MIPPPGNNTHVLLLLLAPDSDQLFHVWTEAIPPATPGPGEILPLPDETMEASGDRYESAGLVESIHLPEALPEKIRPLLIAPPLPGCGMVIVLRGIPPEVSEDGFVFLGEFDPPEARRLLEMLEDHGVPFEIDTDHTALREQGRAVALYLGMAPKGSQVHVYVPVDHLPHSRKILRYLYPAEKTPPQDWRDHDPLLPALRPAMEVYTTPSSEIGTQPYRPFQMPPLPMPAPGTEERK